MKIKSGLIKDVTISELADLYGLTLKVNERDSSLMGLAHIGTGGRFYAVFNKIEEVNGCCLISKHGNGPTPQDAIDDYASEISGVRLVKDASGKENRVEFGPYNVTTTGDEWETREEA